MNSLGSCEGARIGGGTHPAATARIRSPYRAEESLAAAWRLLEEGGGDVWPSSLSSSRRLLCPLLLSLEVATCCAACAFHPPKARLLAPEAPPDCRRFLASASRSRWAWIRVARSAMFYRCDSRGELLLARNAAAAGVRELRSWRARWIFHRGGAHTGHSQSSLFLRGGANESAFVSSLSLPRIFNLGYIPTVVSTLTVSVPVTATGMSYRRCV